MDQRGRKPLFTWQVICAPFSEPSLPFRVRVTGTNHLKEPLATGSSRGAPQYSGRADNFDCTCVRKKMWYFFFFCHQILELQQQSGHLNLFPNEPPPPPGPP